MGELLHKLVQMCSGSNQNKEENDIENNNIRGKLVLKNLDASCLDHIYEFFGKRVSLQLISADHGDQENGLKGKLGKPTLVENWRTTLDSATEEGDATFNLKFEWEKSMGVPGAFLIRNHHHSEFYLKTVTLEDIPDHGRVHFICNSWVYPAHRYKYDRVFFTNKTYLPHNTPEPLRQYREEELINLRGNGSGLLKKWDRVYDYAYYNDLGSPEKGKDYERPVLGGPNGYPYPRRGRTGRPPTKKDPNTESRLPLIKSLGIYVPRDERFSDIKFDDFLLYAKKSIIQLVVAELVAVDLTITEFDDFEDVMKLYGEGVELKKISKCMQWEALKGCVSSDGEPLLKFPKPDVIKADRSAWRTDEEFAREMLAGVNPVSIRLLREFPPTSKLDPKLYGNQKSSIRREGIQEIIKTTTGLTVDDALKENKLFILDHHDALMPYLRRINTTNTKTYASRTLLLLQNDGTLKPLAIELSLPHPQGDKHGAVSRVFSPASDGSVQEHVWQLAKAYAAVNDSGYHQLISHWLNTHAVIEPFVIATNRQLSVLHPIYKLLHPHFRDTMHINANARTILINAGGVLEMTVFPARFSMEMSSILYKDWVFTEHSLPADLLKRGVAVADSTQPHGLRLLIEDYPFAVDGLEIWSAIETWVTEYCCFYYSTDESIQVDSELQQWWTEIREKGHGDKKDEPWWPTMHTRGELIMTCSIMIWVSSALHAAVNFGQYPYAGFLPNRPTVSRRFMPEPGTHEYAELESKPDLAFLKTITAQFQTLLGVSLIEILSRHSRDEIYLGQRETPEWTSDHQALESFERFGSTLIDIERRIEERNKDARLKNRVGPIEMEYTLLMPNTADYTKTSRLAGKGIPNSISI